MRNKYAKTGCVAGSVASVNRDAAKRKHDDAVNISKFAEAAVL
jgi:hypothetical protein